MLNWYAWEISQAEFGKGKDGRLSWTGPCPSCSRRRSPCRWGWMGKMGSYETLFITCNQRGCWFQVINWKPGREEFVSSKTCRYLVLVWFLCIVCEILWDQTHLLSFNGACCNARRPGSLWKAMQLWRQSRRRWPTCVLIFDDFNIFDNSRQNEKPKKNLVDLNGPKAWLYHTVGGQGPVSVGTIKRYI